MARRSDSSRRSSGSPGFQDTRRTIPIDEAYVDSVIRHLELVAASKPRVQRLREFEDRRQFHPNRLLRPAGVVQYRAARRIVSKPLNDVRLKFAKPFKVLICLRRQARKEVLHALKYTGKGSGSGRHRRSEFSGIDCR